MHREPVLRKGKTLNMRLHSHQCYFLQNLDQGREDILNELKRLIPEAVKMVLRHYAAGIKPRPSLMDTATEFSIPFQEAVRARKLVFKLLEDGFETAVDRHARLDHKRSLWGSTYERKPTAEKLAREIRSFGLKLYEVPTAIPRDSLVPFVAVRTAWKEGRLKLPVTCQERYVLMRRYGILDLRFRSLAEVGTEIGVTSQRAGQLESSALLKIGA